MTLISFLMLKCCWMCSLWYTIDNHIPSGNQTWQWEIPHLYMVHHIVLVLSSPFCTDAWSPYPCTGHRFENRLILRKTDTSFPTSDQEPWFPHVSSSFFLKSSWLKPVWYPILIYLPLSIVWKPRQTISPSCVYIYIFIIYIYVYINIINLDTYTTHTHTYIYVYVYVY